MDNYDITDALVGVYYLATTEGDQPHVRPFDGAAIIDGKFYIATTNKKKVFEQIKKNPKVEIFGMESGMIRFTAEAYAVDNEELSKEVYESLGKDFCDGAVAIELKNLKGTLTDKMGEKTEFSF